MSRINFTQENIDNIINRYVKGESAHKIALSLNLDDKTITRVLKNNNIPIRSKKDVGNYLKKYFSQEDELNIVNLYANNNSTIQIAKQYSCDRKLITNIIKNNNIKIRSSSDCHKLFSNENVFENIDCHEKAYWLGFLAADGNVSNHGQLTLQLAEKDLHHLKRFYQFMGGRSKIMKTVSDIEDKRHVGYRVGFKSTKLTQDLAKYGIVPSKSSILKMPDNILEQYIPSYILGLVDGDGSFHRYRYKLSFSLISSIECCNQVMKILVAKAGVNKINLYKISSPGMAYLRYCGNNNIYKIAKFLYSNNPSVYLERKRQVVLDNLPNKYPRDF